MPKQSPHPEIRTVWLLTTDGGVPHAVYATEELAEQALSETYRPESFSIWDCPFIESADQPLHPSLVLDDADDEEAEYGGEA